MSSHYDPIPTDSDDENEQVSEHMSGDDARSDRSRSSGRFSFLQPRGMATDSDPEEDDPASIDLRRPLNSHAARECNATSFSHQSAHSHSSPYLTDPYIQPHPGYRIWEQTLRTLQRWRDGVQYISVPTEEGGSPSGKQDSLLDTTPIIVNQVLRHEDKMDMMENIIMRMPGDDAVEGVQERVKDAEENITYVNDEVQSLKARVEAMAREFRRMDCSIHQMESQMKDCHTMTSMARGVHQDLLRELFGKNKGKKDESKKDENEKDENNKDGSN